MWFLACLAFIIFRLGLLWYHNEAMRKHADEVEAQDDWNSIQAVPLAIKKRFSVGRWTPEQRRKYDADDEGACVDVEYTS